MKKHLLAVAALATLSGVAAAQSVTMYGIIDQSLWHVNNVANAADNTQKASLKSMESGAWLPSLWGFTGSEDLGGGLKANFKLEGNLLDSAAGVGGFSLFDRQSWVGLSGNYGEFRAGNQIDALFLQSYVNNVRQAHSNSAAVIAGLFVGSVNGATGNSAGTLTGTVFSPNTLTYITPTVSGLKATVQYQMGEQAGSNKSKSAQAFLVNYDGIANLSLSAGTKTTKGGTSALDSTATKDGYAATTNGSLMTQTLLGAVYKLGNLQFNVQNLRYKLKQDLTTYTGANQVVDMNIAAGSKYNLNEFGVSYNVTPALTAAVNYVDVSFKDNSGKATTDVTSVSLKYALSKRTSLWTMASRTAKVKDTSGNDGTSTITTAAPYYLFGGSFDTRQSTTGYGVGLTHAF